MNNKYTDLSQTGQYISISKLCLEYMKPFGIYLNNQLWGLDEMCQPILVGRDYLLHMCEQKLSVGYFISSERPLGELIYCVIVVFARNERTDSSCPVLAKCYIT